MTGTPSLIIGRRYDAEAAIQRNRDRVDAGLDPGQDACRQRSKTAIAGIISTIFIRVIGSLMFFCSLVGVCSTVVGLVGAIVAVSADSIAYFSTRVALAALEESTNRSPGPTTSVATWVFSWFC